MILLQAPPTPACTLENRNDEQEVALVYEKTEQFGLYYGPQFRVMERLLFTGRKSQAFLSPCSNPALALDGALHSIAALTLKEQPNHIYVPEGFEVRML